MLASRDLLPVSCSYMFFGLSLWRVWACAEGRVGNQLVPLANYGVKSMSMGYLVRQDAPVAWRGMMVVKALQQLLHEVDWGGLDMLVLDLPPGTGDTQLTIAQQVELDGMYSWEGIQVVRLMITIV